MSQRELEPANNIEDFIKSFDFKPMPQEWQIACLKDYMAQPRDYLPQYRVTLRDTVSRYHHHFNKFMDYYYAECFLPPSKNRSKRTSKKMAKRMRDEQLKKAVYFGDHYEWKTERFVD